MLLGVSQATVSRCIQDYHRQSKKLLPFRGTIHDMGPTLTHKLQAVELKLQGLLTQEIARRIHHTPDTVDAYLTDFERVYQLHQDGKSFAQIAFLTRIARSVVGQYIKMIEEYEITEASIGQLRQARQKKRQTKRPAKKGEPCGRRDRGKTS